jgi:hypothetical protein
MQMHNLLFHQMQTSIEPAAQNIKYCKSQVGSRSEARPVSLIAALLRGLQKLAFEIVQVCCVAAKVVGFQQCAQKLKMQKGIIQK